MAGEDRGPLIAELSDGTKIYRNGVLKSDAFFRVTFFSLRYESEYNPNTGTWGKLTEEDPKLTIPKGSSTSIHLAPGESGDLIFDGGKLGASRRGFEAALVFDEKGEIDHILLGAKASTAIGEVALGWRMRDEGDHLSSFNTITIHPDGTVMEIVHTPGDSQYPGVKVHYKVTDANGVVILDDYTYIGDRDIAARMAAGDPTLRGISQCFAAGTSIDMWPVATALTPGVDGLYDQDAIRAEIWQKPIEQIKAGDIVVSFDDRGNMVPGHVPRTMVNDVKILLNFHGTRVTPGHVYYRADSTKTQKFETLIDILRDDGVIQHQDGTLIRAATNVPVGDPRDGFVTAITGSRNADGTINEQSRGRIRLGTRFLVGEGKQRKSYAVADLIEAGSGFVGDDEMICVDGSDPMPFHWAFSNALPKPEDFVLACSGTTLEDIYKAAEWEGQGPRLSAPMELDRGPVKPLPALALSTMPRNEPLKVE